MKELEHKKRERERRILIEQFESSNKKTGSKLEDLRRNIAAQLEDAHKKHQSHQYHDDLLAYNSQIVKELRNQEIRTLRSKMVQQRKHSVIDTLSTGRIEQTRNIFERATM